ncbi:hypothetical protein [Breznakiella homolactica]|uniref:Uncharacterized protein n=1 Tax=Breznakiella homolactica TaxID=2798577 RepID=A0A7T7XMR0_9SPIR|nr:hypothetical protein [Breznakiella homolactica]QQO09128.1 hypothetical protein JFL75_19705 [Breznakiella homolactica]
MYKRICFIMVLFLILNCFVFSQNGSSSEIAAEPAQKQGSLKALIGITLQPYAFWRSGQWVRHYPDNSYNYFSDKDGLVFDLDSNRFTTYEGELWHKKGFNVGISLDLDNNFVGKLYNFLGRVGYKNAAIRVSGGKLAGDAWWDGGYVSGQPDSTNVDTKYLSVDLLIPMWWIKDNEQEGIYNFGRYFGLSYTRYEMPLEFQALTDDKWAYPVYEDTISFNTYGLIIGFETMNWQIITRREGFFLWLYTQDTLFGGPIEISDEGARRLSEANPGKTITAKKFFLVGVQYDLTVGLGWSKQIGKSMLGVGLGYNISGRGMVTFGGGQPSDSEITPQSFPYLFRHGVVLKAAFSR